MASVATKHAFGIHLRQCNADPTPQGRALRAIEAGLRARRRIEKEQARDARRAARAQA